MSFKREGNDKGQLDNLRRRRIKELFAEEIPEDEAKLLCNGRFACLVCYHNPIFDTVNMLMVHRAGKKHAAGETVFLQKKKELKVLIAKRKHEQYMKDGTTNIKQAQPSTSTGLCSSERYDPRVKKHKVKPYARKPCLDLAHSDTTSESDLLEIPQPAALPAKHSHQLKNIFRTVHKPQLPLQPYVSHRRGNETVDSTLVPPGSQTSAWSQERCAMGGNSMNAMRHDRNSSRPESTAVSFTSVNTTQSSLRLSSDGACNLSSSGLFSSSSRVLGGSSGPEIQSRQTKRSRVKDVDGSSLSCTGYQDVRTRNNSESCGNGAAQSAQSVDSASSPVESLPPDGRKVLQKYHELQGSGWKKDWDGKWIRDEDAEFDSDEEPPDLP